MLKRGLSIFLVSVLMTLSFFSVPVFAAEDAFDIADYTIEDLKTMTAEEKKNLLDSFIETYNPYGIKELMEQESNSETEIQPYWISDSDKSQEEQQAATHQFITLQAVMMFMLDYGFYDIDMSTQLIIALYIAAASGLPDLDERDGVFAEHFYDPRTGMGLNIFYGSARDKVENHFKSAYNILSINPYMSVSSDSFYYVMEHLGRAFHFIQDVCEPHHASTAAAGVSTHTQFEEYVEKNINILLPSRDSMPHSSYAVAKEKTVGELTHDASLTGRSRYNDVENLFDQSKWESAAQECLDDAICYSARLMYKLFASCGVIA